MTSIGSEAILIFNTARPTDEQKIELLRESTSSSSTKYYVLDGHKRVAAGKLLRIPEWPAVVVSSTQPFSDIKNLLRKVMGIALNVD